MHIDSKQCFDSRTFNFTLHLQGHTIVLMQWLVTGHVSQVKGWATLISSEEKLNSFLYKSTYLIHQEFICKLPIWIRMWEMTSSCIVQQVMISSKMGLLMPSVFRIMLFTTLSPQHEFSISWMQSVTTIHKCVHRHKQIHK